MKNKDKLNFGILVHFYALKMNLIIMSVSEVNFLPNCESLPPDYDSLNIGPSAKIRSIKFYLR